MSTNAFAGPWSSLPTPLTPWILEVVSSMGHTQMTPVQAATIPLFMGNKDVVVEAVTGSGKTLAFVIPVLERLLRLQRQPDSPLRKGGIGAIVVSPTRELAAQTHKIFELFLSSQPSLDSEAPSGSSSKAPPPPLNPALLLTTSAAASGFSIRTSPIPSILVSTPGSLLTFLSSHHCPSVRDLDTLVLDEADRLLDPGFTSVLTKVFERLPKQRRTGLFSATMTDAEALAELVRAGLRNPARVVVRVAAKRKVGEGGAEGASMVAEERRIPASLQNNFIITPPASKLVQLARLISHEAQRGSTRIIVYFSTCAAVDYFYRVLPVVMEAQARSATGTSQGDTKKKSKKALKSQAEATPPAVLYSLHGHLQPAARTRALETFAASPLSDPLASSSSTPPIRTTPHVLLATDVAARGLDLPRVDAVVQFDAPTDPRAFAHRIGRTARAGHKGAAWVFLSEMEEGYVDFMKVRKVPMKKRGTFDQDGNEKPIPAHKPESDNAEPMDTDTLDTVINEDESAIQTALSAIRTLLLTDRALHDKAAKAFVSSARAYGAHEASFVFRMRDVDLCGAAQCYGLLRMPRMPEWAARNEVEKARWVDAEVDWDAYSYKDVGQERKRQEELKGRENKREKGRRAARERREARERNGAWSREGGRKEERGKRREKRVLKAKWTRAQAEKEAEAKGGVGAVDADAGEPLEEARMVVEDADLDEEMEDWAEERAAKKAKLVPLSVVEGAFDDL